MPELRRDRLCWLRLSWGGVGREGKANMNSESAFIARFSRDTSISLALPPDAEGLDREAFW